MTPSVGPGAAAGLGAAGEDARRAAVERLLGVGAGSGGLDRVTRLAATLLDAAAAQVCLLTDVENVVSSSPSADEGGPAPAAGLATAVVHAGRPVVARDAADEPLLASVPAVAAGTLGAVLGVPLRDRQDQLVGALTVSDAQPRTWTAGQVGVLAELAPTVVAELELRAVTVEVATSAARLELALSAADIGSFDWDMVTGDLTWDERLIALFGYDSTSFRSHIDDFVARVHPDDVPDLTEQIARAEATGDFSADYRIVRPDGDVRWVEARGRVLRPGPDRRRMLGAAYDVTARYEADAARERAYREREQAVVERERAYAQAAAANTRLAVLADAAQRLGASLEPREVLAALADVLVPQLGRWLVVAVPAETAAAFPSTAGPLGPRDVRVVLVRHADAGQQDAVDVLLRSLPLSLDDPYGVGRALATGEPELLQAVDPLQRQALTHDEEQVARLAALGVQRSLTVPLVSRGRVLAALSVAEPVDTKVDRALLVDLAGRAAVALDNALLYGAERATGITLQRSLLPREVPALAGIDVAARYLPGDDGAFVGGDWYQGVPVGDRLVLAMGDVMGHGMRSAARMGQLRAVVATLALEGHPPGLLLARLAASTDVLLDLDLATLLVAELDPAGGRMVVASAGHPPPLLAVPGQPAAFVDVDPGPPLGTFPGLYPETLVDLPVGATVLLYTDGLVENRSEALTAGLERLRAALADTGAPAEQVADDVLRVTGRRSGGDDDVALLVLRRTGQGDAR